MELHLNLPQAGSSPSGMKREEYANPNLSDSTSQEFRVKIQVF